MITGTCQLGACVVWAALSLALSGCGSAALDDPEAVRTWAVAGSAVGVWANVHSELSLADGRKPYADPKCPATSDDGTTVVVTGGCTASDGNVWKGKATVTRANVGDRTLQFDAFGGFKPDQEATKTGQAHLKKTGPTSHDFDVDLVHEGGMKTTIKYRGHVEGDWDVPTVWSGSGQVQREGVVEPTGEVEVSTVDERVDDDTCSGQPVSGHTKITNGDDEAVVTYDGATACDGDKAARWSFNGEDQGLVTGITCATRAVGAGDAPGALGWLIGFAALLCARRRQSR